MNQKRKGNVTSYLLLSGVAAAILLSGCQKSPEKSMVKNKDLDQMVEEAGDTSQGSADLREVAGDYETYQTTIEDESLHVAVRVDAKVDVPKTDQMSVFRVKQSEISQEFLNKVKDALVGEEALYEGRALNQKTKGMIEQEIAYWNRELDRLLEEAEDYGGDIQVYQEEYQNEINKLREAYETAPDQIDLKEYATVGSFQDTGELLEQNPGDDYYTWVNELNPDGKVFYGVSDGQNGSYLCLYAQNNEDYGNCIRFFSNKHGYVDADTVVVGQEIILGRWKEEEGVKEDTLLLENVAAEDLKEYSDMPTTITRNEARLQAEELLNKLGLTDFQFYDGDLYCELVNGEPDSDGTYGYRKAYVLQYLRNIDGAFVSNEGKSKFTDEWQGENYVKKEWGGESIEITVNNDGIIGFSYNTPLEVTETVVEKSGMKPFEEIRDIFEQMVVVTNAQDIPEQDLSAVQIDIHQVALRYTRISEADSFDTGLLVPVWDFIGTRQEAVGEKGYTGKEGPVLTVNAIDGSIIDRELGY